MNSTSYIPSSDSEKVIWLNNFSTKINLYAATLGITATELTTIQDDASFFSYIVNLHQSLKQTLNNLTGYKTLLKRASGQQNLGAIPAVPVLSNVPAATPEGVFDRIAGFVKRIKGSPNYTSNIGADLGVLIITPTIDYSTVQPDLKINLDAGRPHIKCQKGYADALDLYVDRKDGAGFVLITRLLKPDYIDVVSLPVNIALAEWDYKARYVLGNNPVGLVSSVVSIVVKQF